MGDVVVMDCTTTLDIPVERVLCSDEALACDTVIVVGWDKNGDLYFASSTGRIADHVLLLEVAKAAAISNLRTD